jgi:hypothetical protein
MTLRAAWMHEEHMTKKSMLTLALTLGLASAALFVVGTPSRTAAQTQPVQPASPATAKVCDPIVDPAPGAQDQSANQALAVLKQLATPANGFLGFQSAQEVAAAKLEAPADVYFVGLTALDQYFSGDDPRGLLRGGADVFYPVSANGNVRSFFRMRLDTCGQFTPTEFSSYPAPAFAAARDNVLKQHKGMTVDQMFMLEIPALHKTFVAYSWQSALTLMPTEDDPAANLKAGTEISAHDAYMNLKPEVKKALANSGAPSGGGTQPAPGTAPKH